MVLQDVDRREREKEEKRKKMKDDFER